MTIKQILIHHSASSRDKTTVQDINAWHKLRWPDFISSLGWYVGYHFVITGDGKITQTRRNSEMGAHTIPNDGKLGICLTGNFMVETPSEAQISSLNQLVNRLVKDYNLKMGDVKGHREFSKTECPGDNLFKWVLENRIGFLKQLIETLKKMLRLK